MSQETFRARNTVPFALALAAVGVFSFLSGGYILGRSTPVVVALLVAAAVWVWFLRRSTRPSVLFLVALAAFAAFTAWSGLSLLWSLGPDLTLGRLRPDGVLPRRCRRPWVHLGPWPAVAYRRLRFSGGADRCRRLRVPGQGTAGRGDSRARLRSARQPDRYWNVLAVMMVMGLLVALAVGGDRGHPGLAQDAGGRGRSADVLHLLLHVLARRLAGARASRWSSTSRSRRRGLEGSSRWRRWSLRGAGAVAAAWSRYPVRADDRRRAAHAAGAHAAALVRGAPCSSPRGVQLAAALVHRSVRWPRWSAVAAGAVVLAVGVRGGLRRQRRLPAEPRRHRSGSRTRLTRW